MSSLELDAPVVNDDEYFGAGDAMLADMRRKVAVAVAFMVSFSSSPPRPTPHCWLLPLREGTLTQVVLGHDEGDAQEVPRSPSRREIPQGERVQVNVMAGHES